MMKFKPVEAYKNLNMRLKLGIVLLTFGLVGLINFVSVTYFKRIQKLDTAVVDVAGRQRMLSQRIAFLSEQIYRGKSEVRDELSAALKLCDTSLYVLEYGGIAPGIGGNIKLPATEGEALLILKEAELVWLEYKLRADGLLQASISNDDADEAIKYIESNGGNMLGQFNQLVQAYVHKSQDKQSQLGWVLFFLLLINIGFVWIGFIITSLYLRDPILQILDHVSWISKGQLGKHKYQYSSYDEIGTAVESLEAFDKTLHEAAKFAREIGEGNYEFSFDKAGENDMLGSSLLEMRDKLKKFSEEDRRQSWVTKGLAKFSDILRSSNEDLDTLRKDVVREVVKYMGANQGVLFILNEDSEDDPFMELMATYAWDRHKYISNKNYKGHGLIGQVWLEAKTWYMTEIPQNYINISSGLGEALPSSVCIVPLSVDEKVYGILEIASFVELETYQINFLEKLCTTIASTLENSKSSERTKALLKISQQQTEEMRAQEEEMRQNQEELQSTQEEMERQKFEMEQEIKRLRILQPQAN